MNEHTESRKLEPETAECEEQDLPSLEIVYNEVKDRLDVQIRQIDSLDSKSGTLLFISSIVIGLGAAAQAALIGTTTNTLPLILFSIPVVFYVLTVILTMRSWIRSHYYRDPEPRPLRDFYSTKPCQFTKRKLITQFISSFEWNATIMKKKTTEIHYAVWFFLAEVVTVTLVLASRPWLNQLFGG